MPANLIYDNNLPSACGTAIHRASIKWRSKGTLRKTVMGRQWRWRTETQNKEFINKETILVYLSMQGRLPETKFYTVMGLTKSMTSKLCK